MRDSITTPYETLVGLVSVKLYVCLVCLQPYLPEDHLIARGLHWLDQYMHVCKWCVFTPRNDAQAPG